MKTCCYYSFLLYSHFYIHTKYNTYLLLNKTKHGLLVGMTSDKLKDKTEMILNSSATHIPFPIKVP